MEGQISSGSGKVSRVTFQLKHLTETEKRKLALKSLGFFWLLSVVSIPLPPIHWVTVPGFFLFGIYQFFKKMREPTHLEPFVFPCPECGQEVPIKEQVAENPLGLACPHCRYALKLEWDEPAAS
ncbi:MAG: hypothetical protein ACXWQO_01655 [Bdellovibrionota bacterium]